MVQALVQSGTAGRRILRASRNPAADNGVWQKVGEKDGGGANLRCEKCLACEFSEGSG